MKSIDSTAAQEIIEIVDGYDRVVRTMQRQEMRKKGLLHRVTYLLIFNSKGEILVQQRTKTKDWYPGRWDFAAGGVVQADEHYDLSAERELYEELAIEATLEKQFKIYFEDRSSSPHTRSWGMVYRCNHEGPFTLQAEEVQSVQFMTVQEALAMDVETVTPDTRQVLLSFIH